MQTYLYLKRLYTNLLSKLIFFVQLQLFMALVSLPILIAWGLPISIMSLVGNLIFSPFLTLFLLLSSLLFFFELCHLPNGYLVYGLECCTQLWSWCIACGSSHWLVGFAKPSFWILCTIFLSSFFILHCKKLSNPLIRTGCFIVLISLICSVLKWDCKEPLIIKQIPCNGGFVTLIKTRSTLTVIDPGVIGKRVNSNWVEYTLIKEIVENFGSMKIDSLILTRPTILTLDYAAQICRLMHVASLYLVTWHGESNKRLLQKYGRLRYELTQKKGKLLRIAKEPILLTLDKKYTLEIKPLPQKLLYKDSSFSQVGIRLIEGESNTLLELQSQ